MLTPRKIVLACDFAAERAAKYQAWPGNAIDAIRSLD
jgi:hypothetical protein